MSKNRTPEKLSKMAQSPDTLIIRQSINENIGKDVDIFLDKKEMQKLCDKISPRDTWSSSFLYFLTTLGLTLGAGNFFFFPANVYEYRGGAYLIAYGICLVFFGAPVLYLEMFLGQYHRSSMLTTIRRIVPALQGVGWMTFIFGAMQLFYYQYIIGLLIKYVIFLVEEGSTETSQTCGHAWNDDNCFELFTKSCDQYVGKFRGICTNETKYKKEISVAELQFYKRVVETKSQSFFETSNFDFSLCACVALSWMLIALGMNRGIRGVGNFLMFPPMVLFAVLPPILYQATSQNGSADGISALLNIEYKHFINVQMWVTAIKQVIFSLGLGCGGHYILSSLAPPNTNTFQYMMATATFDTALSICNTILLYSSVGYLCYETKCDNIHELNIFPKGNIKSLSIYSVLLKTRNGSGFAIFTFYFMIIINCTSTIMGGLLALIVTISEIFNKSIKKFEFNLLGITSAILYSIITGLLATGVGQNFVVVASEVEYIIASINIILEVVIILEFYGVDILCDDICVVLGRPLFSFWSLFGCLSPFWVLMWKLAPAISAVSMINYIMFNYSFLNNDESFSQLKLLLALCFLVQIPAGWFYSHLSMKVHFELFEPGMVYSPKILWLRQRQLRSWPRYFSQLQIENEEYAKELDSILPNHEEFDLEGEWELTYRQFFQKKYTVSTETKGKKRNLLNNTIKLEKIKMKKSLNMLQLKQSKQDENKSIESVHEKSSNVSREKSEKREKSERREKSFALKKTQSPTEKSMLPNDFNEVMLESDFTQEGSQAEVQNIP